MSQENIPTAAPMALRMSDAGILEEVPHDVMEAVQQAVEAKDRVVSDVSLQMRSVEFSNYQLVAKMNEAFGNPKGDPYNIDWKRLRNQCKNILDEFGELMVSLGMQKGPMQALVQHVKNQLVFDMTPDLEGFRDALSDIHVFAYGAHHLAGINADRDLVSTVDGVMTRFIKDDEDLMETVSYHANKGVTDTYTLGEYPMMVLRSGSDQPDAPKDKFLKSSSYRTPIFYDVTPLRSALAGFNHDDKTGEPAATSLS